MEASSPSHALSYSVRLLHNFLTCHKKGWGRRREKVHTENYLEGFQMQNNPTFIGLKNAESLSAKLEKQVKLILQEKR